MQFAAGGKEDYHGRESSQEITDRDRPPHAVDGIGEKGGQPECQGDEIEHLAGEAEED